jgi:hypothetical protein
LTLLCVIIVIVVVDNSEVNLKDESNEINYLDGDIDMYNEICNIIKKYDLLYDKFNNTRTSTKTDQNVYVKKSLYNRSLPIPIPSNK